MWAVLGTEACGFGFLADRRPAILFERHVFHRLTKGRFDEVAPPLSSPMPGGYAGGAHEYGRLAAATALEPDAALMSASWGIGQVMGCSYASAGFPTAAAMVAAMVCDEDAQLAATAAFIAASGLAAALQRQDWAAFAAGYNGPDFQRNYYDRKLAAAYARYLGALPGLRVREVQAALLYLGCDPGPIDGVFGARTRAAVIALQRRRGIAVTGAHNGSLLDTLIAEAWP